MFLYVFFVCLCVCVCVSVFVCVGVCVYVSIVVCVRLWFFCVSMFDDGLSVVLSIGIFYTPYFALNRFGVQNFSVNQFFRPIAFIGTDLRSEYWS